MDLRKQRMRRILALALAAVSVALVLVPLAADQDAGEYYASSGRMLAMPVTELPGGTISVNMADLWELTELPGIGETLAQRIIDERVSRGYFQYPEDLLAVRGIGEKTLAGMLDWLDMTVPDQ